MSNYRRHYVPGGTYFFTVVTYDRRPILCTDRARPALHTAIQETRCNYPFETLAWVLLPDHLHCIWRLPDGDDDFTTRWRLIKSRFTRLLPGLTGIDCRVRAPHAPPLGRTNSRQRRAEHYIWQRRFWEHHIRDENELCRYCDYIHYNPVKHGLVAEAIDWPYSTIHRPEYEDAWRVRKATVHCIEIPGCE